ARRPILPEVVQEEQRRQGGQDQRDETEGGQQYRGLNWVSRLLTIPMLGDKPMAVGEGLESPPDVVQPANPRTAREQRLAATPGPHPRPSVCRRAWESS